MRSASVVSTALVTASLSVIIACGNEAPPPACPVAECGITCFDPDTCGSCGNAVCDEGESFDSCRIDCCDATLCDPSDGERFEDGDARCDGAPDGTRCEDGDPENGVETCRAERCLHEAPMCRCVPPGGVFPEPEPDPNLEPPPIPEDPVWVGDTPTEASFEGAWGLRRIDLSRAWAHTRGDPDVRVAIVDSGCDAESPDLLGAIASERDVLDDDDVAQDVHGHGTYLASLVAARADGEGAVGVAPGVSLLCVRVLAGATDAATASYDDIADGIDWAVSENADVILVGLAGIGATDRLHESVQDAAAAGAVLIAPAGSFGGSHVDLFPAAFDEVISVAGTDVWDVRASGTDLSPRTALGAPGVSVIGSGRGGIATTRTGSSAAAGLVAGVVALVVSVDPSLSAEQVRGLLIGTGQAMPIADYDRVFRVRRLDAGSAVSAAAEARVDAAIGRLELASSVALPGDPWIGSVWVENRGVGVADIPLSITAEGGVASPEAMLEAAVFPGERREVRFEVRPNESVLELTIEASVALDGDADPTNDRAPVRARVGAEVLHHLRVRRAEIRPPVEGDRDLDVAVEIENVGDVPEPASELRIVREPSETAVLGPAPTGDDVVVLDVPPLAVGERVTLEARISPARSTLERHRIVVYQRPAAGQTDISAALAWINYPRALASPRAATAYMQLAGENVIADAPWRTMRDTIPVLIFYARADWSGTLSSRDVQFTRLDIRNPAAPALGAGPLVYRAAFGPDTVPDGLRVTDEFGAETEDDDALIYAPMNGAHRIVWLPRSALPNRVSNVGRDFFGTGSFLSVEFRYASLDGSTLFATGRKAGRVLGVALSSEPLPRFDPSDHYFDPHYHSVAEFFPGLLETALSFEGLDDFSRAFFGPEKAYGGPLEMLLASAWAIGTIDDHTQAAAFERVITTDHNTFFDDPWAPAGPSSPGNWITPPVTGSPELDIYRGFLGRTAGEEVSLPGSVVLFEDIEDDGEDALVGRHALLYDAQHVNGDWGQLTPTQCTPSPENLFRRMTLGAPGECPGRNPDLGPATSGQLTPFIGGFTFAAHPFLSMFRWRDDVIRDGLSFPGFATDDRVSPVDGNFVFRGFQFWNQRPAQKYRTGVLDVPVLRRLNPFAQQLSTVGPWVDHCDEYRDPLAEDVERYLGYVRDGLEFSFDSDETPRRLLFRKIFTVAGSDAHGDFNYQADLCATRGQTACAVGLGSEISITDSAFMRPRTYVFGRTDDAGNRLPATLEDMRRGRAVLTDGPIVELEIDGESRGSFDPVTGNVDWHDGELQFDDADGVMGGDGALDGEGTAFIPFVIDADDDPDTIFEEGSVDSQQVTVRTRCMNATEFYGGSPPTTFDLITSGEAYTDDPPSGIDLMASTEPAACDGGWQEQVVTLGSEAAGLRRPLAALVHTAFDYGCPDVYEAYTNPVWVAPVQVRVPMVVRGSPSSDIVLLTEDDDVVDIAFPMSMRPDDVVAKVYAIDAVGRLVEMTGGAGGGELVAVTVGGSVWQDSPTGEYRSTSLQFRAPEAQSLTSLGRAMRLEDERFVLVVSRRSGSDRRLHDASGNPIGAVMARFRARTSDAPFGGGRTLSVGFSHTCALPTSGGVPTGEVRCWGYNGSGELGSASLADPDLNGIPAGLEFQFGPVTVEGIGNAVEIAVGGADGSLGGPGGFSCAVTSIGRVFCWGRNSLGQLGDTGLEHECNELRPGVRRDCSPRAIPIPSLSGIVSIDLGMRLGCGLGEDGRVFCWGHHLGVASAPQPVELASGVELDDAVAIGVSHRNEGNTLACALRSSASVVCWREDRIAIEASVDLGAGAVPFRDGTFVSGDCAIRSTGQAVCLAGLLLTSCLTGYCRVGGVSLSNMSWISNGLASGCGLESDRTPVCWGSNGSGQLGRDGPTTSGPFNPAPVLNLPDTIEIDIGTDHACAATVDDRVFCWGYGLLLGLGPDVSTMDLTSPDPTRPTLGAP